ncbi:MAG TPA: hypothetical protein PKZ42_13165 [Syntrophales bacterium]|nr:hypothetical protein [Syntrophales bacterium]
MKNIFFLYIPPNNTEAIIHYQDTIINKVSQDCIFKFIDQNLKTYLRRIFQDKRIAVWGSRDTPANRAKFEKMGIGDNILIVEGDTVKLLGFIAAKTVNQNLSGELWKNISGKSTEGWDLIYFISNPLEIDLPFIEVNELLGYQLLYKPRGFSLVSQDKLKLFYTQFDDLYSILQRIKLGEQVMNRYDKILPEELPIVTEDLQPLDENETSEHVKMQWKLINLGRKAGSEVWVPKNDQKKIVDAYGYSEFEHEFAAGIDLQAKYVENIDVVWKQEFRVDAAFEIEHSTSIYSGLLRFSDLKIVAPNSVYPLYIVAPLSQRNKIKEQVKRPTFKKMDFDQNVRYLPYETVNEIDRFFENSSRGLNTELIYGKSESLT